MDKVGQDESLKSLFAEVTKYNYIDPSLFEKHSVKRGLRNSDGTGVVAGLTQICNVHGYLINEGDKMPVDGELIYRGINIKDIIKGYQEEGRFGYEEVVWLLLSGKLPTNGQIDLLRQLLQDYQQMHEYFFEDVLMRSPTGDIMNALQRGVLALYSYDPKADDTSVGNVLRQSIELMAKLPIIMTAAYHIKNRHFNGGSMYFHHPQKQYSIAENILATLRPDMKFSDEEAKLLDLCLVLHAEHGGGNNSTFVCRSLTSSGTDTYSAIAGAIGSLKGPRHGGANIKVAEMMNYLRDEVKDWNDDDEISAFLSKIVRKEAGDRSGLIYGMGHAIYTKSDPRAIILKDNAKKLAKLKGFEAEFALSEAVERLAPDVLSGAKDLKVVRCANVDLYSGLVYRCLGIPEDLYTPMFAVARLSGWCAHRIEEIATSSKIMRPAYKAVSAEQEYISIDRR